MFVLSRGVAVPSKAFRRFRTEIEEEEEGTNDDELCDGRCCCSGSGCKRDSSRTTRSSVFSPAPLSDITLVVPGNSCCAVPSYGESTPLRFGCRYCGCCWCCCCSCCAKDAGRSKRWRRFRTGVLGSGIAAGGAVSTVGTTEGTSVGAVQDDEEVRASAVFSSSSVGTRIGDGEWDGRVRNCGDRR